MERARDHATLSIKNRHSISAAHLDALRWFGRRQSTSVQMALADRSLEGLGRPWNDYERALTSTFRLTATHCFSVPPYSWAAFHEPQITKGIAHFLSIGTGLQRRLRIYAFLRALRVPGLPNDAESLKTVEAIAEQGRIDLKVLATTTGGVRIGAVIEAKLGHKITSGQLPKYKKLSLAAADELLLCVVAPGGTKSSRRALKKNESWQFHTWRSVLLALEEHLPAQADDDEFRRFRRTVWEHAYDI
jgi:hypothetical protein